VSTAPRLTQDRLTEEEMGQLVEPAFQRFERGDLEDARREFDRLLGSASPELSGDLLTAFGVLIYNTATDDRLKRAALPYLERAIPAQERRFGLEHPEVALALNTFADAVFDLEPVDPPRSVDEALGRALSIRLRTLGPRNTETLHAMIRLAEVKGLPSRTNGDPARISEAASLFEEAARARETILDAADFQSAEAIRFAAARMYVQNCRFTESGVAGEAVDGRGRDGDPPDPVIVFPDIDLGKEDGRGGRPANFDNLDDPCYRAALDKFVGR
jgi:hypothetical protein